MNLFIGICSIIVCTALGWFLSLKYYDRKVFYNDFYAFNKKFLEELSFSRRTISELLTDDKSNSDFYNIAKSVLLEKKEFKFSKKYLTENEKEYLKSYFESLGKIDVITQKNYINTADKKLNDELEKCLEQEKKLRPVYIKLGFFVGLIVFVAVI